MAFLLVAFQAPASAGPLRDRLAQRANDRAAAEELDDGVQEGGASRAAMLPAGVRLLRDVAYGPQPRQRMDVYLPPPGAGDKAAVVFLVHGGGWRHGDKAHERLVQNKVARWVPRGVVLVSVNYRLLPEAGPDEQLRDVARALATAQRQAPGWGADPQRFLTMGHSAGAHLVALLAATPALAQAQGALPVRGTVALDSAALDVPRIMEERHARLYDQAFGSDPAFWRAVSPLHQLQQPAPPLLAVCSTRRRVSCDQAQRFAAQGRARGMRVEVLPQDLSHGQVNEQLGLPGAYTDAVEAFMWSVDGKALR